MIIRYTMLATVPLCLLGACTVGPDYSPQRASELMPSDWIDGADAYSTTDISEWWDLLDDAELTALIQRGISSSLTLEQARERIIAARARRGIQNADRLPSLNAEGAYTRTETGDDSFSLSVVPAGSEADIYSLGAVAGWELDLWGRVARLVEAADAEIEFAIEDYRASRISLAAEIAREVILIRSIDRDLEIVESTVETSQDSLDIARARSDAGIGEELDAARAMRDLEANLALLPMLRADRRAAEFRISVLLGEHPSAVQVSKQQLPQRVAVPALGVPADLLLQRPDLRRAERAIAAATARVGAAEAERYPRVTLSGSIALQGPDIGDTVNADAFVLSMGPSVSLPIFEGGRIRSQIEVAESDLRLALLDLRVSVIVALSEVETARVRRVRAEERVERLAVAESAAQDAETLSMDRYTAGRVDFLDVTESRRSRLSIERELVRAERDALLRLIDLYTSLGGGWPYHQASVSIGDSDPAVRP